jgi:hypothetical protein
LGLFVDSSLTEQVSLSPMYFCVPFLLGRHPTRGVCPSLSGDFDVSSSWLDVVYLVVDERSCSTPG